MRPEIPIHPGDGADPGRGKLAWNLLLTAAVAATLVATAAAIVTFATSDATVRGATVLVPAGLMLLRGLVVYGIRMRGRWALWTGALLALLSLPAPLLAGVSVEAPAVKLELTGASLVLAWLNAGMGAFFLVALLLLALARRK